MAFRVTDFPEVRAMAADLALALRLLAEMFSQPLPSDWETRARELLERHGVERTAGRDSSLLAWGAHLLAEQPDEAP